MHDPAVSKADEMIDGQAHSQVVVGNDRRYAIAGFRSIDQDDGEAAVDAEGDKFVVL